MQATADGEFYPEKNLDRSYKIPKRGPADMSAPSDASGPAPRLNKNNPNETPLADSYYNYPYDPRVASAYYQDNQYYGTQGQGSHPRGNNVNFGAPPPPPPSSEGVGPIKQNIFNALKDIREKPKRYDKNIYEENNDGYGNQGNDGQANGQGYGNRGCNNNYGSNNRGHGNHNYNDEGFNESGDGYQMYNKQRLNMNLGRGGFNGQGFNRQQEEFLFNKRHGFKHNSGYKDQGYGNRGPNNNQRFNDNYKLDRKKPAKEPTVHVPVEQTVPDLLDSSLPKDLKLLFQPLFCKLCSAQLSSNQTAKMHYKSKNHEKKIRKWLTEWAEKTGEPLHQRAVATGVKKEEDSDKNPTWFHCDVCDLELTGQMHAESHYMGKNHQKALLGHKAPAGQGYYKDGKWVRVKGQKSKSYDFERGEDNFGMDFKKPEDQSKAEGNKEGGEPPAKKKKESQPPTEFHCDVCSINTTCQEQLDNHYRGQKHVKKLKQLGLENYTEQRKIVDAASGSVPVAANTTPSIPDSPPIDPDMNLAVYRTPSGDYYCPTCNITTNSEPQFLQHMKSKGHAKKASQKKSKPAAT